jgi:hypothetical protein
VIMLQINFSDLLFCNVYKLCQFLKKKSGFFLDFNKLFMAFLYFCRPAVSSSTRSLIGVFGSTKAMNNSFHTLTAEWFILQVLLNVWLKIPFFFQLLKEFERLEPNTPILMRENSNLMTQTKDMCLQKAKHLDFFTFLNT